jgi:drug/metabolite transporter (DMT)-like permease
LLIPFVCHNRSVIPAAPSKTRYRLLLFAAAFLFSTGGAAIKACSLTSWQIACFRSGIAAITVAILLPEARKIWRPRVFAVASAYAATLVFYVLATKLTSSAHAIFLQSTAPLYLLLLAPWLLREPRSRSDLLMVTVVATGAMLLLFGRQETAATVPDPLRGNWFGALSGIAWALTMTGFRWLAKHGGSAESPASVVVAGNLLAFLACLPMAIPIVHAAPADIAVLLYLGVVQIGLAYMAVTRSIQHVPAIEATTLLLLEPVFNPLWTWLLQGERLNATTLAGGALILCATLGSTWYQSRGRLR